jgi:hypothetical protein
MATLNDSMQALINNLHGKVSSNEALERLSAEERALLAMAIGKLSGHHDWPQAVARVAEEHLGDAEQTLNQTQATVTDALANAEADIGQAQGAMTQQNTDLGVIPTLGNNVKASVNDFEISHQTQVNNQLANMPRPVFGLVPLETPGIGEDYIRGAGVFAIYDATGDSFLLRPSTGSDSVQIERNRMEFVQLFADGSGQSVIASHYCDYHGHIPVPSTYIGVYGNSAIVPLATMADSEDIAYEPVYSVQNAEGNEIQDYGGVFCRTAGNTTITRPKLNVDAVDQWGMGTITNHNSIYPSVLYDNIKHCLVMVDDATSLLVEKYRDGNIFTTMRVEDSAQLTSHVNNGDFTVVKFIANALSTPYGYFRVDGKFQSLYDGYRSDAYGFFGPVGGQTKMGGNAHNAHYRFTAQKKLEPLNYFYSSSVKALNQTGANGTVSATADLTVAIADMQGQTLGVYHYQSKSDTAGHHAGIVATALMCMNPYSHIGILNDYGIIADSNGYYGISRTCKAY